MTQPTKAEVLMKFFTHHSLKTSEVEILMGSRKAALNVLREFSRAGIIHRDQQDWTGTKYETRGRKNGKFTDTVWVIDCEVGRPTMEQISTCLYRVLFKGEDFYGVAVEMGIGC